MLGTLCHDERIYQAIKAKRGETDMSDYVLRISREAKSEGIRLGRSEGRNEGIITTLIKQLKQRLGNLSKEMVKEINRSNKKQLDHLTLHIFDIESEEDIKKILLEK